MPKKISLSDEQAAAVAPTFNIVVQANAGTGKTFVLVQRLLRLLFREYFAGRPPAEACAGGARQQSGPGDSLRGEGRPGILCLTYTNAGASEMRARVLDAVMEWARADDARLRDLLRGISRNNPPSDADLTAARKIFYDFLDDPGRLKVQTIHGFCEEILRRFAPEAGIPPSWRLVSGPEQRRLLKDAFQELLNSESFGSDKEVAAALDNIIGRTSEYSLNGLLDSILGQYRNIVLLKRHSGFPDYIIESTRDYLGASVSVMPPNDYENREKYLTKTGGIRKKLPADDILTADKVREYDQWLKNSQILRASKDFLILCGAFADKYAAVKTRRGLLDFDDLLLYVSGLFANPKTMGSVLSQLDHDIRHILVDESQDNSKLMWDIIFPMLDDMFASGDKNSPRTFFAVGDSKQSIFSFQGASPSEFDGIPQKVRSVSNVGLRQYADVLLSESRRTAQAILGVVDFFFNAADLPGFPKDIRHKCWRKNDFGKVEIHSEFAAENGVDAAAARRKYMKIVADRIENLVRTEKIDASDIMVLLQRRDPFAGLLESELKRRDIESAGSDRIILPSFPAVADMLNILRFANAPNDKSGDLALANVLRGPIFRLSERELFDLCANRDLARPLAMHLREKNAEIIAQLDQIAMRSNTGPYEFFAYIMRQYKTRFISALGRQALDPLNEFMTQALAYERTQSGGLTGFLRWFLDGQSEIRRDMGSGSGVRVLTVHSSKGLEAGAVFLIDTVRNPSSATRRDPFEVFAPRADVFLCKSGDLGSDRFDDARAVDLKARTDEYWRLLYVAMTRARDQLFVFGCAERGRTDDSWHSKLYEIMPKMPGAVISDDGTIAISSGEPAAEKIAKNVEISTSMDLTNQLKELINRASVKNSAVIAKGAGDNVDGVAAARKSDARALLFGADIHRRLQYLDINSDDDLAREIRARPRIARFFAPDAKTEVPIAGTINGEFKSLRIDRMLEFPNGEILFMDYKTDRDKIRREEYLCKMSEYKLILEKIFPSRNIRGFLLWLHNFELDEVI